MLDWIDASDFPAELATIAAPAVDLQFTRTAPHMPTGHADARGARLEHWCPEGIGTPTLWKECRDWWLAAPRGASSPNWDFAAVVWLNGQPGLLLVEAKANVRELSGGDAKTRPSASAGSQSNDRRIRAAVNEASLALARYAPGVTLSADHGYQLSNRVAFGWKLASMGIPTAIIYLGFLGDQDIADVGEPLRDHAHWSTLVSEYAGLLHAKPVLDSQLTFVAPMWFLVRSRRVMPKPGRRVV